MLCIIWLKNITKKGDKSFFMEPIQSCYNYPNDVAPHQCLFHSLLTIQDFHYAKCMSILLKINCIKFVHQSLWSKKIDINLFFSINLFYLNLKKPELVDGGVSVIKVFKCYPT